MSGLIAGFIGGAGKGMAIAGQMEFKKQIDEELNEANFLRRSALRREMVGDTLKHRTAERVAGEDYTTGAAKTKVGTDATVAKTSAQTASDLQKQKDDAALERAKVAASAAGGGSDTSNIKNVRFLMSKEGGAKTLRDALIASFPNATLTHTDEEGNIGVAVLGDDGLESIGSFRLNDQGIPEFVKEGDTLARTKPTKKEREESAAEISKAEGTDEDYIPFNETSPSSQEAKDAAAAKLAQQNGLVGSQMDDGQKKSKTIRGKKYTKQEFIDAMVQQHGQDKLAQIEETWLSIQ